MSYLKSSISTSSILDPKSNVVGVDGWAVVAAIRGCWTRFTKSCWKVRIRSVRFRAGIGQGCNALVEQLQAEVQALHDYLREIENRTTLELPRSDADFHAIDARFARKDEIRETAAVYSIR